MSVADSWLFDPFTPDSPMDTTHLRRTDYFVQPCSWYSAKDLIAAHHYSGSSSDITIYRHGLYRKVGTYLVGVAVWMLPTKVAAQSVHSDWQRVLCLTRLAISPNEPTNSASFLLGRSIRLIKQEKRFHTLLTYADEAQGHTGAIYKATNWQYVEPTERSLRGDVAYVDRDGKLVSKRSPGRSSRGSYTDSQMAELGYQRVAESRKHKFVMTLWDAA